MKKIAGKYEKLVVEGRDVYIECESLESSVTQFNATRDVNLANHLHVTQVIQGSESLCDLEGKLIEALNSRIFLPDSHINNRIRVYRLEKAPNPTYEALNLSLKDAVPPEHIAREESKLIITGIYPHNGTLFTMTERPHSNREKEYRIFLTDIDTKKTIHVSPALRDGPSFRLGSPTLSDALLIPRTDKSGYAICRYDNGKLHPITETSVELEMAWHHRDNFISMTSDSIYIGQEKVFTTPDYFTGYTHLGKDILFMSTKDHLVALDLATGERAEYQSWFSLNDIIENGGIHMLTGDESGIAYSHFESSNHLIRRKADRHIVLNTSHFKDLDRAWIQDPHVFLVAKSPDTFYAVYHENGKYQPKAIHVSQFDALRGEVQKDVL